MDDLPLHGIRVLDVSVSWAGPRSTTLLAELGAEVIKVEAIQYDSVSRGSSHPLPFEYDGYFDKDPAGQPWNRCARHSALDRNKRGITLDLQHPEGRRILSELITISDVVVHAYRPRVSRKLGLDYESVAAIQPDAVVLSMPLFGSPGPYAEFGGYGNITEAVSGIQALRSYRNGTPTTFFYGDVVSGSSGAFGVLAALAYRAETGIGQHVEVAQSEACLPMLGEFILDIQLNGSVAEPIGNEEPSMAPHGCYRCRGSEQYVAIAVPDDATWQRFCAAINRPDLADDPDLATVAGRLERRYALDDLIEAWTEPQSRNDVVDRLVAANVPVSAVIDHVDLLNDPHIIERGFYRPATHAVVGTQPWLSRIWHIDGSAGPDPIAAPILGQHNRDVLHSLLAVTDDQLEALTAADVIGTAPISSRTF